ncbi:MAG: hypothetical protein ABIH00_03655 [Armatimonadota bacterium]
MFKKIIKYIERISVKNIDVDYKDDKLNVKLDNLSLNAQGNPDLVIKKLVLADLFPKKTKKAEGSPLFRFEGIDVLISQNFITSILNIIFAKIRFIDYLKFRIDNSKLILKGAVKKYILFPFYIELDFNQLKNFLCIEFKSLWLMDILPFPTFTLKRIFKFIDDKMNLPFMAFEGNRVFIDFEKIEYFKKNNLILRKIRFSEGFINLVVDVDK